MDPQLRQHLLHFMRTECLCDALPESLLLAKSMQITIGLDDGTQEIFRVHAWEDYHEGPWFDSVQCDLDVHGQRHPINCIGKVHHLGELWIPSGPRKGLTQPFLYVDEILSDHLRGLQGRVNLLVNPDPKISDRLCNAAVSQPYPTIQQHPNSVLLV